MAVTEIIPFAFEDKLVRAVQRDGKPWFVGVDVCECLGLSKPHTSLDLLDDDERASHTVGGSGGDRLVIVISEPGVYRLVFRSRKPEAERFKRWLAHVVLPDLLATGKYAPGGSDDGLNASDPASEAMLHRLNVVREARILFGLERARSLWRQLGLPAVPPPPAGPLDEARACLRHLLDYPAHEGGPRVRELLALALDDDEEARLTLLACGVRVMAESDCFVVANRHPRIDSIFKASAWCGPLVAMRVLRRLPGAEAGGPMRWPGPMTRGNPVVRGTVLRGDWLDEFAA